MNPIEKFAVSFGQIARTLVYQDHEGTLVFCYDVAPPIAPETKWTVYLGEQALSGDSKSIIPPSPRTQIGFERTSDYLVSCGYTVQKE